MKTTEFLEQLQSAFYDVVDVAETNLPEPTGDEDTDELIQDQLNQYDNALETFKKAYKELMAKLKEED
ncbi:MAG: hypothetical protein PUF17_08110 [Lactimicrobium massiliense]|nr:hypothetical protein [Lactimicrobium massiliense]MDD6560919.1 hypothetical protein [Lactimicrobium massiliense]